MKIRFITKYLSLFFILLLCSCSKKPVDTIRIGVLDGPSVVSFIQLIDQQPIIKGKRTEIIIKSEPQQIQTLMMQGKLDFAILPTLMAANLYNKGVPYRMVACPIWGTLYVLTNTSARNLSGLRNQSVSVFGQSSTADVLLQRMIQKELIPNVIIDYKLSTNTDIAQALKLKKIKFAVVSEPLVSKLLAQDSSIHILTKLTCEEFLLNSDRNVFVQTAFLVSSRFIKDNAQLIAPVCKAYASSCNFTNNQPEKVAKLMVLHKISPTVDIAKQSIPLCNIHYVGAFAVKEEMESYLKIFYKFNPKSVGGKIPYNEFIYTP